MIPLMAEMLLTLKVADPLHLDVVALADRTLLEFVHLLKQQEQLTNSELAMLMGRSVSTFYERRRRLEGAASSGGVEELQAVYDAVLARTAASPTRAVREWEIQGDLPDLPEGTLAASLRYLVRFGMLAVCRGGRLREYRLVPPRTGRPGRYHDFVITLYAGGPSTLPSVAELLGLTGAQAESYLERLSRSGKLETLPPDLPGGPPRYRATGYHIAPDELDGWYASLWIHFRAVCKAIIHKARERDLPPADADLIGGTTFEFDVPIGSSLEAEIGGFLAETRGRMEGWLSRVQALEQSEPDAPRRRITIYTGQMVTEP